MHLEGATWGIRDGNVDRQEGVGRAKAAHLGRISTCPPTHATPGLQVTYLALFGVYWAAAYITSIWEPLIILGSTAGKGPTSLHSGPAA